MKTWTTQDAKAKFSELLDTCATEGAQLVTRRGEAAAVLVPYEQWERLNHSAPKSLRELLLQDEHRFELELPDRASVAWRDISLP
jgi:antitoxin Phd